MSESKFKIGDIVLCLPHVNVECPSATVDYPPWDGKTLCEIVALNCHRGDSETWHQIKPLTRCEYETCHWIEQLIKKVNVSVNHAKQITNIVSV